MNVSIGLRLKYLNEKLGPNILIHSADYWLESALRAEQVKRLCGPRDPAFRLYAENQRLYEEAAALVETMKP